jgi:hypothetical protein
MKRNNKIIRWQWHTFLREKKNAHVTFVSASIQSIIELFNYLINLLDLHICTQKSLSFEYSATIYV